MATTTKFESAFPDVPNTPVELFNENDKLFRTFGPTRYFVFAQYFIDISMKTYLQEIIGMIQEQRRVLGTKDCNYDVNQLRILVSTLYAFNHIIYVSKNAETAKTCIDALLYMLNKSFWQIFKKYINVSDRDDSQRYFSMLLARSKIEFNDDPTYKDYKGGSIGKVNRRQRNCTYKRKGRKGFKTRRH